MDKHTVRVSIGKILIWPQNCILCLGNATKEYRSLAGKGMADDVPYCESCSTKVRRLDDWIGGLFMVALILGGIGALIILIQSAVVDLLNLLRIITYFTVFFAGFVVMGVTYVLGWLLLLPLRLVFHNKLSRPGIKVLKSKDPAERVLKFSNPDYVQLFCEANGLT